MSYILSFNIPSANEAKGPHPHHVYSNLLKPIENLSNHYGIESWEGSLSVWAA